MVYFKFLLVPSCIQRLKGLKLSTSCSVFMSLILEKILLHFNAIKKNMSQDQEGIFFVIFLLVILGHTDTGMRSS